MTGFVTRTVGFVFCCFVLASVAIAEGEADVQLSISEVGFKSISNIVSDKMRQRDNRNAVPARTVSRNGQRVTFANMNVNFAIDSVNVKSVGDQLLIEANIANFVLDVGTITVHRLFPVNCYGTQVHMGFGQPITMSLAVRPVVVDGKVDIDLTSSRIGVGSHQYRSVGPSQCRGRLFNRPLIRSIVAGSLQDQRQDFARMVLATAGEMITGLEGDLNEKLANTIKFAIRNNGILKSQELGIDVNLVELRATDGQMHIGANLDFSSTPIEASYLEDSLLAGSVKVKESVVNRLLSTLFAEGTNPYIVLPENFPEFPLDQVFTQQILSEYWPDLSLIELSNPVLLPEIQLLSAPQIEFGQDQLKLMIPELKNIVLAEMNGTRVPYFALDMDIALKLRPVINGERVQLFMLPESTIASDGQWTDSYVPQDDRFNRDAYNDLLAAFIEIFSGEDPVVNKELPSVDIGQEVFVVRAINVDAETITIDIGVLPGSDR